MPSRMKFGKVFLSGFTSLARSASTEADVFHKCRLPPGWAALLAEMLQDRIQRANAF